MQDCCCSNPTISKQESPGEGQQRVGSCQYAKHSEVILDIVSIVR